MSFRQFSGRMKGTGIENETIFCAAIHKEGEKFMSKVKNEPSIKNPLIAAIREQLEHRALWMYLLCDEAAKKGLQAEDYAPAAIRRCGLYQGGLLRKKAGGGPSLKGLKKTLRWTSSGAMTTIWTSTFTTVPW